MLVLKRFVYMYTEGTCINWRLIQSGNNSINNTTTTTTTTPTNKQTNSLRDHGQLFSDINKGKVERQIWSIFPVKYYTFTSQSHQ